MALITCPECGGKISDKADFCPHCGYNQLRQIEKSNYTNSDKNNNSIDKYLDMTEKELNLLIQEYVKKIYPQLFVNNVTVLKKDNAPNIDDILNSIEKSKIDNSNDIALQQKEYCQTLDNIFNVLEKLNSENEMLLMSRKYKKIPYLHLALWLSTFQYLAISKSFLESALNLTISDVYEEIGLHLEFMNDDFGKVFVLNEKYNDFIKFTSVYNKIRFREKNLTQGDYIIYQFGSPVDNKFKLNNPQVSLHLGDFCHINKDFKPNRVEKVVWHSTPTTPKKSEASLATRAVVGGIIAGPVGAIAGMASGIDENLKAQSNNNNTQDFHIEYINDDSYILTLSSNIVWGFNFSLIINNNRDNYIKYNNIIYERIDELYRELIEKIMAAQNSRQQMYAWINKYNDLSKFEENSDEALECLKLYNPNLYAQLIDEINEKKQSEKIEKEKLKNQYIIKIEEKQKAISEWQNKYDLYKSKIFGEGKKMKDYSYSQLIKFQEEKKSLEEALNKLEDK